MYDRKFGDQVLAFEPSGGLMNSALVMRDRPTDSWWSIITGSAIGGKMDGTDLKEIPGAKKMKWKDWRALHPDTKVLSVKGREHVSRNPYSSYVRSDEGFRGQESPDKRMKDKQPIFAFQWKGNAYAVAHDRIRGGASFKFEDKEIFLYREPKDDVFASTFAYVAPVQEKGVRFQKKDNRWVDTATGVAFDPKKGFQSKDIQATTGFDTYWYIWSTTHKNVKIL